MAVFWVERMAVSSDSYLADPSAAMTVGHWAVTLDVSMVVLLASWLGVLAVEKMAF